MAYPVTQPAEYHHASIQADAVTGKTYMVPTQNHKNKKATLKNGLTV